MARFSLLPRDRTFFDLFIEAGQNTVQAARLLDEMMHQWPDDSGLSREILKAEQEGDRITHDIVQRLNSTFVTPIDREDIYGLATQMDDIVDYTEEAADFLGLYKIEAPMSQAGALTKVLVAACEQLAEGLEHLRDFKDLDKYWIEIHRLENEGDRISRDAVASLFSNGIDPMVVIRWKDMFAVLENAIDATETAAQILEGIVIKNLQHELRRHPGDRRRHGARLRLHQRLPRHRERRRHLDLDRAGAAQVAIAQSPRCSTSSAPSSRSRSRRRSPTTSSTPT